MSTEATTGTVDRSAVIVNGLQCNSLGGWKTIFSFTESKARTYASVACVAFLGTANSVPRSATFGCKQLIEDGELTLAAGARPRGLPRALRNCNQL